MRILYGTDGSEEALAGARMLNALALTRESSVRVVTAAGSDAEAEKALQPARAELSGLHTETAFERRPGSAADALLQVAAEWPADLVVVGSRGLNPISRLFLGSVAERVVHHAPCAVLVARRLTGPLERVVLGLDGSQAAVDAADYLRSFPLPPACEVRLVTSIPLYQIGGTPAGRMPSLALQLQAIQAEERRTAEERLEDVAAAFRGSGRAASTEFRTEHPADGLLRVVGEQDAGMIAVGRLGLSGIERFSMGSVSTAVLRHAPCSVLVVPDPRR